MARQVVRERGGRWYDPDLTKLLLELCDRGLLDELGSPSLKEDVFSADSDRAIAFADEADIDRIASAFADIVDAKSPWTGRHSQRVAVIGYGLAFYRNGDFGEVIRDRDALPWPTPFGDWPVLTFTSSKRAAGGITSVLLIPNSPASN